MVKITEMNPVYSKISNPSLISNLLAFEKTVWIKDRRKNKYGKSPRSYDFKLVGKDGVFLTGFLPKVFKHLKNSDIDYEFDGVEYDSISDTPSLKGVSFREDQLRAISLAVKKLRGVLLAPTGAGKTVIVSGIISCLKGKRVLFLCHNIDLAMQARNEFIKFGLNASMMGGGEKDMSGEIVSSTIQTFSKLSPDDYGDVFDAVICDECHHMSKFPSRTGKNPNKEGMFYKVLSNLIAPIRFAVTATYPVDKEVACCLEGLVGEVVSEMSFKEAVNLEILATPEIILVPVEPFSKYEIRKYADIYEEAVVNNEQRNRQVIKKIKMLNRRGLTTLTYVQRIDHIKNLLSLADKMGAEIYDVQGAIDSKTRLDIKKKLLSKEIKNVVATVVWREGIDIRSLNCIIIAGGGKNEKDLIQACGRGARRDEEKDTFIIVDFVDSAKYLSQHFCERLKVYLKKGWI